MTLPWETPVYVSTDGPTTSRDLTLPEFLKRDKNNVAPYMRTKPFCIRTGEECKDPDGCMVTGRCLRINPNPEANPPANPPPSPLPWEAKI
jgi:hypothetical protein